MKNNLRSRKRIFQGTHGSKKRMGSNPFDLENGRVTVSLPNESKFFLLHTEACVRVWRESKESAIMGNV